MVSQMQEVCVCGGRYWPKQRWMHEGCSVTASVTKEASTTVTEVKKVVTETKSSTNAERQAKWRRGHRTEHLIRQTVYRLVKAGRACWWPKAECTTR